MRFDDGKYNGLCVFVVTLSNAAMYGVPYYTVW